MSTREYLYKYGYLSKMSDAKNRVMRKKALMKFQEFFNITITGRADRMTKKMSVGRCGMKDFKATMVTRTGTSSYGEMRRRRSNTLYGSEWDKKVEMTVSHGEPLMNLRRL